MEETAMRLLVIAGVLWVLSMAFAACRVAYARRMSGKKCKSDASCCPPVTLVVLSQNQEQELRKSLPLFLGQDYPGEMYVSVVDVRSEDDTMRYLEDMESRYRILSHSSVPASARDISMQRLAMALGFRSASTDWVIFTHAGCCPSSSGWLASFASHCGEGKDAVVGATVLQRPLHGDEGKYQWLRLWRQCRWMPWAEKHRPVAAEDSLFACRTGCFMKSGGFGKDNMLVCGASALLLNRLVEPGRCAAAMEGGSVLTEHLGGVHRWTLDRMYSMETSSRARRPLLYRFFGFLDAVLPLLLLAIGVAAMLVAGEDRVVLTAVPAALIVGMAVRSWSFSAVCRGLGVPRYYLSNMWYELLLPFWTMGAWLRWKTAGKNTFRKKFV